MASELHVDAIKHSGGTSALTIDSSGNVHKAGFIVQVVSAEGTTSTDVSGTTITAGGVTASITPKFSTSKIFVAYNLTMRFGHTDGGRQALFRKIDSGSYSNIVTFSRHVIYQNHSNGSNYQGQFLSFSYVDSPNTTGVVTYSHATDAFSGATTTMNPNHTSGDTQTWQLMEIAQ
jgi:hypothetical protein